MSFNVLEPYDFVPIVTRELANKIGPTPAGGTHYSVYPPPIFIFQPPAASVPPSM